MLADQEAIDKQTSRTSVKNNEQSLFIDKKRHWFRGYSSGGSKRDINKSRDHKQESSSQIERVQRNCNNGSQYKPKKKFKKNCYNYEKNGHMAKECWSKKKFVESNVATSNQKLALVVVIPG